MEKILTLLLLSFAVSESVHTKRQVLSNLDNGRMCALNFQCKSKCCAKDGLLSMPRCADEGLENQECSATHFLFPYKKCPCGTGLVCDIKKTFLGTIFMTDTGICRVKA